MAPARMQDSAALFLVTPAPSGLMFAYQQNVLHAPRLLATTTCFPETTTCFPEKRNRVE